MTAAPSSSFPNTAWSCIDAAKDPDHPKYRSAVDRLVTSYWRPVFRFLRGTRHVAAAADLTHEFFCRCLEGKSLLRLADPTRGRFRDFLRTVVKRFAYDQTVRPRAQTKFEQSLVSIHALMTESDRAYEPPAGETPEEAFDKAWRLDLLGTVRRNLFAHYENSADPEERQRFAIFAALHLAEGDTVPPTQEALAQQRRLTRDQVRHAVKLVKQRYHRLLRQEIRDQVGTDVNVEEEMGKLL